MDNLLAFPTGSLGELFSFWLLTDDSLTAPFSILQRGDLLCVEEGAYQSGALHLCRIADVLFFRYVLEQSAVLMLWANDPEVEAFSCPEQELAIRGQAVRAFRHTEGQWQEVKEYPILIARTG